MNQISIFELLSSFDPDDLITWCDNCVYDCGECCAYDEPLGDYCVCGSAYIAKE